MAETPGSPGDKDRGHAGTLPGGAPGDTADQNLRGTGRRLATSFATFHVHLGGLHNFLVDHKVRELSEEDGTGVDEDRVIKERSLHKERRV